jgi:hypothetical protein
MFLTSSSGVMFEPLLVLAVSCSNTAPCALASPQRYATGCLGAAPELSAVPPGWAAPDSSASLSDPNLPASLDGGADAQGWVVHLMDELAAAVDTALDRHARQQLQQRQQEQMHGVGGSVGQGGEEAGGVLTGGLPLAAGEHVRLLALDGGHCVFAVFAGNTP